MIELIHTYQCIVKRLLFHSEQQLYHSEHLNLSKEENVQEISYHSMSNIIYIVLDLPALSHIFVHANKVVHEFSIYM